MYFIKLDDNYLYYPGDDKAVLVDPVLDLSLDSAGKLSFICPKENPLYDNIYNRRSMVSVYRDKKEIFYGEVRNQEKDFSGNKKVLVAGVLSFLSDSVQNQNEYHGLSPRAFLTKLIDVHNLQVEDKKKFHVGIVTVTDPNDSLYRFTNYETTYQAITEKLVDRLGGYLRVRHEKEKLYLDYLALKDIGKLSKQTISFGLNLLDYTESISAENIATAVIPLGAGIQSEGNDILREYVDITAVNDKKNYLVNEEALKNFGWVCSVEIGRAH